MQTYPLSYLLSSGLLFALAAESFFRRSQVSRPAYLAVLATVFVWYIVEPVYHPGAFTLLPSEDISDSFVSVGIFLISFRLFAPLLAIQQSRHVKSVRAADLSNSASELLAVAVSMWGILLVIGIWRMNGNVFASLFPNGRSAAGSMWGRNAVSTSTAESLLTIAGYLYILMLATFGVLLVFVKSWKLRLVCILLIAISWPYAFLSGARNVALAVVAPGMLAFMLYSRASLLLKAVVGIVAFLAVEELFRLMITYRNIGFFQHETSTVPLKEHLGLDMATELIMINGFLREGQLNLQYGLGYILEAVQLIPRFIWADKPFSSIDYAVLRGFGGNSSVGTGVFATISQGLIGQGVRQFGTIYGPIATAFIMAGWVRILSKLAVTPSVPRTVLYLMGLGLTFNMGRDITLLVLWPFLLGYGCIITYEHVFLQRKKQSLWLIATPRP